MKHNETWVVFWDEIKGTNFILCMTVSENDINKEINNSINSLILLVFLPTTLITLIAIIIVIFIMKY
jgi:hypothetical protein